MDQTLVSTRSNSITLSSTARTGGAAERGSSTSLETSNGACLLPSSVAEGEGANVMEAAIRKLVPPLSHGARKGQMGRIGVLGGSADFTGAPYYAGMASLKVRCVFTCRE